MKLRQDKTVFTRDTIYQPWTRTEYKSINAAKKANGINGHLLVGPLSPNQNRRKADRRKQEIELRPGSDERKQQRRR